MSSSLPIRHPCPPGACDCQREQLLESASGDQRILLLTKPQEQRLLQRLENLTSLADLEHMQRRMFEQLGIRVEIAPGFNEVRSMRGISIEVTDFPGLCRKTRKSIPSAIRRGLERNPQIAYALLDADGLFRDL